MPGVPSSRGCDACRKVKKKCDQIQPTCSRCRRLKTTCVGGGQQRYMFKNQPIKAMQTSQSELRQSFTSKNRTLLIGQPTQVSLTNTDTLAASFIEAFEVTDIRYAVAYYGPFLRGIPRRLGNSAVLDAAVRALSTAYPSFRKGTYPPIAFAQYGQSLRALRECLDNPIEARSSNTLCALYLITICQSWLGKDDDTITGHSQAIAHLLRAAAIHEWNSTFEMEMIITLCIPLIVDGMVNPRIKMEAEFWDSISAIQYRISAARPNNQRQTTTELRHLAMFPVFIQNPESHLFEIARTYMQLKRDTEVVKQHLDQCAQLASPSFPSLAVPRHSKILAAYAMLCTLTLMLNGLLKIFDPFNESLLGEGNFFRDEITTLAELASCYRPVGSAYIPLCLVVSWATSDDLVQLAKIKAILGDYQTDFAQVPWMSRAIWLASTLDNHRVRIMSDKQSIQSHSNTVSLGATGDVFDTQTRNNSTGPKDCCVM